jgi:hypothetical protein
MATFYHFGELPGEPVGTEYANRAAAAAAGVHQVRMQGIAGNRTVGCASIVMSGGYDTDEDHGHEIFYTGRGGQNPANPRGPHIADQDLTLNDNAALVKSESTGKPLRIVRGAGHDSPFAPATGYRYDGLYKVAKHYPMKHPADGFVRWMFHLVQLTAEEAARFTPAENRKANAETFVEKGLGSGSTASDPDASQSGPTVDPFFGAPALVVLPDGASQPGTKVVVAERVIRGCGEEDVQQLLSGLRYAGRYECRSVLGGCARPPTWEASPWAGCDEQYPLSLSQPSCGFRQGRTVFGRGP